MRSLAARRSPLALWTTAAVVVILIASGLVIALTAGGRQPAPPGPPARATPPLSMFEEYHALQEHPARTLQTLRSLGVGIVRVLVFWNRVAADPRSFRRPAGNLYPTSSWGTYDRIVRDARRDGIKLDFLLTGGAPLWATGPGAPASQRDSGAWKPSAEAYRDFVRVVGDRYSGRYTPPGAAGPLPRVDFWEIWNEPNWGPTLEPQLALHPLRIVSAAAYRGLLDAAWTALWQSGHGQDTVLIGGLSPRGTPGTPPSARFAATGVSSPLGFTRALYCVGSSYQPLRGDVAIRAGCPTTAAGSRAFVRSHPALFKAAGFAIHPYPIGLPPTETDSTNPDNVEFSQIPHLITALDRVQHTYGSSRRMDIYNTEYGYITDPPNPGEEYVSPATAAVYLNWAEYLTWRNPRIATTMQYGLYEKFENASVFGRGGFATALIFNETPLSTFYAYRMPIFLPVTRARRGDALEVWGCARPAPYAYADTHRPQQVQIQFRPTFGHRFRTIRAVRLTPAHGCYLDLRIAFPSSGAVRLQWSYPRDDRRLRDPITPGEMIIDSRSVAIRIG